MISFESLLHAAHAAARGKRFKPGVARFVFDLERQLLLLHEELASQTYRPGPYRTFTIYEGKTRQISAAPFRDRVVHHALTGVLEPILDSDSCPFRPNDSLFDNARPRRDWVPGCFMTQTQSKFQNLATG